MDINLNINLNVRDERDINVLDELQDLGIAVDAWGELLCQALGQFAQVSPDGSRATMPAEIDTVASRVFQRPVTTVSDLITRLRDLDCFEYMATINAKHHKGMLLMGVATVSAQPKATFAQGQANTVALVLPKPDGGLAFAFIEPDAAKTLVNRLVDAISEIDARPAADGR